MPAGRFARESGAAGRIADLAEPVLSELGFRLVRVQVSGRDGHTVQIMAEREDGYLTIDECETISRELSPVFDAYDIIEGAYRLEVSSPGIDRPLVRPVDIERWAGQEAKVELAEAIDGRKRLRGTIEGFSDGEVRLVIDLPDLDGPRVIGIKPELIASARLVMTDELMRAAAERWSAKKGPAAGEGQEMDIELEKEDGADRRERKPAGAAPDRGRGGAREVDRPADRDRRHGGRHPKGG
ncbi:MAG: ribosome maturation factor RimP [Hyphomicrobiaceae bacterium]